MWKMDEIESHSANVKKNFFLVFFFGWYMQEKKAISGDKKW